MDGVGVGWCGDSDIPGVFRSTEPASSDRNRRDLAAHIDARLVLAHIRASIGSPVQQTNCHPFRHGRWLWMHNGYLDGFGAITRDLVLAVAPELFPAIEGSTDSELFFFRTLTFGLAEDPPTAVARAVGFIEKTAEQHLVAFPVRMTVATADGETCRPLRHHYPDIPYCTGSQTTPVSWCQPLGDLRGAWREVPESTCVRISGGTDQLEPFHPAEPGPSSGGRADVGDESGPRRQGVGRRHTVAGPSTLGADEARCR